MWESWSLIPELNLWLHAPLSEVQNGLTTVCIMNPTNQDLELDAGLHLEEFNAVSMQELQPPKTQNACCAALPVEAPAIRPVNFTTANMTSAEKQLEALLVKFSKVVIRASDDHRHGPLNKPYTYQCLLV